MAQIIGRRQYSTQSSRIIPNVLPKIILIDEDITNAGFLAFFTRVTKEGTSQEKFNWDVDQYRPLSDLVNGAVSGTTATTIDVDNPTYFNVNELWTNKRTGEIMQIVSVNTATSQITVVRAISALNSSGGTAAAAINDNDTLIRVGPVVGENSSRQTTATTTPSQVFNYCQQMRWDLSLSRRQIKRAYETGDELPYQTKKQLMEAKKQINGTFLVGEKSRFTDSDGNDVTTTGGIMNVPTTYNYAVGGTLHENAFDEFLIEEALRVGSRNKLWFASTQQILAITQIAKERLTYNFVAFGEKSGSIGVQVMEYMAPNGGKLMIVEDRFLSENFNGDGVIVDMSQLKRRVFSRNGFDDDLHIIPDTNDPDDLGHVSTLYCDMGLQWGAEQNHALITGVTGGATGSSGQ